MRGKEGTTSPRAVNGWAAPDRPHTGQKHGLEPGTRSRQQEGCENQPELVAESPQTPAPGRGPRRKEAVPEVSELSPSSFSAPRRAPRSPQGPAEGSLEGGWTRQRNFTTSCHPGHVPAVRDLVSTRLLGHPCGACVQISGQAVGGARPLAPQEVEGKESLWKDPPHPRTKRLFRILTPDRREGAWEAQGRAGLRRR